ncbi:MAG TPA: protein phosphatase 2C domain-containing protein [Streptosporangiaceae bacterium]|jgi:protein phosphatase|nr:protein phosphatase 2C domain-containing protein [Streptosporangiaceae bacterium]
MTLALRYAVRSDVGLLREGNEDSAYASPRLLAVADGMGGHAAGEVASAVAIASVAALDGPALNGPGRGGDLLGALKEAVHTASDTLHQMASADPAVEGMGTTLTALLWAGQGYALCHIGDSRGYMLRDGELYQITHDHSLVQSLVDEGRLSQEEAATHPQRSLILRALDGRGEAEPDLSMRKAMLGDRYLLCSDGLSDVVSAETLHHTLSTIPDLDDVTIQLIELAIRGGGPDNITVVVADVVDDETESRPLTSQPIMAGAASHGNAADLSLLERSDSPAGRAQMLAHTAPQTPVMLDDRRTPQDGWAGAEQDPENPGGWPATESQPEYRSGHRARRQRHRRRWPIVTMALVVLAAVVIGGGYGAWAYTQHQYFVGTDDGHVAVFKGVNQKVAGISLSSVYSRSSLTEGQVPPQELSMVQGTISATSLADANRIVAQLQSQDAVCRTAYGSRNDWVTQQAAAAAAAKASKKAAKPAASPEPTIPSDCPAATVLGVPAPAASPSATPSTSPSATTSPTRKGTS